ncbi:MAG: ABC transporter substrate-binding protein [Nitrospinota bacterium]|nr:ABC transporter substrate-binding protein [Nitrospinota bacterium]MDP6617900.1 ABC transporter substrate-binding protein [Nitrospinota bacterium]
MKRSGNRWTGWMAFAALGLVAVLASPSPAAEKVAYSLDWIFGGRHAAFFTALEKGYWKSAGLDVTISRGFGSGRSIKTLVAKGSDFGFVGPQASMVARARGEKVKLIAMIYARSPYAIFTMAKSGIKKPKDLEGRLLGAQPGDGIRMALPAFALHAGFDNSKVKWLDIAPSAKAASLLAGKVEGATNFIFDRVKYNQKEKKYGKVDMMLLADFGFEIYANAVAALDSTVATRPKAARGIVAGLLKGIRFTLDNPDAASAIVVKRNPHINAKIARGEVGLLKRLVLGAEQKAHCIGWMDAKKMESSARITLEARNISAKGVDIAGGWTNEFLPCK